MDFSGPGFVIHGWWIGVVLGLVAVAVAAGNWRRFWYLPVLPALRGVPPPFLAGGQAGIGVAAFLFSGAELSTDHVGWHTALVIAGFVLFAGALGIWAVGSRAADRDNHR